MAKITDIMLLHQPEQKALVIEHQSDIDGFSRLIGESFTKLAGYMDKQGLIPADIPFVEYPAYAEIDQKNIRMIIGIYTSGDISGQGNIKAITVPSRTIAVCLHKGNYNELAQLYNEMETWAREKGYKPSGTSIEHYYTGPDLPEEQQVTRLIMPLK